MLLLLAFVVAAFVPMTAGATDSILYGSDGADTIVYGDILQRIYNDKESRWECENLGAGVCVFAFDSTSPFRGDFRSHGEWTGTGWHYLYGDNAQPAQDYIYPADLFAESKVACDDDEEIWVSIDGSLTGCDYGSAVAPFDANMWIQGDYGVSSQGNNDHIWGWQMTDAIGGNGGDDYCYGGDGGDIIGGGDGNDYLFGGYTAGDDLCGAYYEQISGGNSNDHIYGCDADNASDDTLAGDAGNDVIAGYDGDDVMDGGTGNDTLYGGYGADDELYGGDDDDCLSDDGVEECDCGDSPGDDDDEDCPGLGTECENHVSYCIAS